MWVKRVKLGVDQWLVQAGASGSEFDIRFTTSDQIRFSTWDGSNGYGMITTRVFRDVSAWYHLVFQYDTAQATDTNRNKIYVNGEQISPSDTSAYNAGKHPPQNYDNPSWNNTTAFRINDVTWTSSSPKDAVYSHIHHTDGYAYDASTFGSTDATTGEWKINTSPSITMGTNGFTILKDGNTITDQSSNSNNFTLGGGTLTKTEDCPDNVFATLNPLDVSRLANTGNTFSNGNLTVTDGSSNYLVAQSTLAATTGKFYWEVKINATTSTSVSGVGVCDLDNFSRADGAANTAYGWIYAPDGDKRHNSSATAYGDTYAANDIIGIALDMTNGFLYFSKNGTWQNSGNPESGASGTNAAFGSISGTIGSHAYDGSSTQTHEYSFNFGNGYFGSTQISSAGTNASGIGIFEYDVPTGYTALSTKGLNL